MSNTALLEVRNSLKWKKPDFIRQDYQRRKRLGRKLKWRKPKGIHSKIRHHFKGRRKMPSPGYKSPVEVMGLHSSGLRIINIFSINDLGRIRKENEGIIISKNIGLKNRYQILKKAKELNISILNMNIDEQIKKIEDFVNSKKKKDTGAKKEAKPQKEAKAKETEELTDKDKNKAEKKEKDKVLTKKV